MEKSNLHKDDVKILDNIIKVCLENGIAQAENLPDLGNGFLDDIKDFKQPEYLRYFKIIQEYDVADVFLTLDSSHVRPYKIVTERFKVEGGFKNIFDEQQKIIESRKRQQEKEINEAILSKWHKKTYWWTFCVAIAGFIMALIALFLKR